jgi:hypothetical protein
MRTFADLYATHGIAGDPEQSAAIIIGILRLSASQRDALGPLVLAQCELMDRGRVRLVEQSTPIRSGRPADLAERRERLLAETFALGDGTRVLWGAATVEQHQQRVAMLAAQRDGIDATIARHLAAIAEIEQAKVTCLAEITEVAA